MTGIPVDYKDDMVPEPVEYKTTMGQNNKTYLNKEGKVAEDKPLLSKSAQGMKDKRVSAARERAKQAAARAQERNAGVTKTEVELEVTNEEYIKVAQTHPIEKDMDVDIEKQEVRESRGLVAGPGENLQLTRIGEQALKMLGSGLKPAIVASALGVTPAYISQLLDDDNFAQAVTERKIVTLTRNNEHDDNIHDVEAQALNKLKHAMQYSTNMKDLARVFSVLNNAKRRGAAAMDEDQMDTGSTVVTLQLPAAIRARVGLTVEVNDDNQVVKAGAQTLGAISPKHLMQVHREGQKGAATIDAVAKRVNTSVIDSKVEREVFNRAVDAQDMYSTGETPPDIKTVSIDDL